jgi:hypothetical protein
MTCSVLALLAALPACDVTAAASNRVEQPPAPTGASNPLRSVERPAAGDGRLQGRVEEIARAGSYSYLRVAFSGVDSRWVVTLGSSVEVGDRVSVRTIGTKRNFRSRRLGRTFDELLFAVVRPLDQKT